MIHNICHDKLDLDGDTIIEVWSDKPSSGYSPAVQLFVGDDFKMTLPPNEARLLAAMLMRAADRIAEMRKS